MERTGTFGGHEKEGESMWFCFCCVHFFVAFELIEPHCSRGLVT